MNPTDQGIVYKFYKLLVSDCEEDTVKIRNAVQGT
jgi:hypothetical protein